MAIPSDAELDILTREIDIDENGLIGFTECAALISQLGVQRTVDVARASNSLRATLRSYLYERQWLLLWRDTYDRMDSFPSDGQIDSLELGVAFEQLVQGRGAAGRAGQGYGFSQRIDTIMKRHGTDGDNQISFDEFKAKASDMVASGVQYERAVAACCTSERGLVRKVDAERRAALANAQNVPLDASMLAAVEARIQAAFAAENGLIAAAGVMRVQDDLYRRFKAKYAATLEAQGQRIDDTLTPKRVLLLDAITAGDLDGIRSLTQMSWDFIYPPAYVDPVSGERQLEAWCRTPLCLLVRPDEGNFESKLCGISEEDRQALLQDPNPNPNLALAPTLTLTLTLTTLTLTLTLTRRCCRTCSPPAARTRTTRRSTGGTRRCTRLSREISTRSRRCGSTGATCARSSSGCCRRSPASRSCTRRPSTGRRPCYATCARSTRPRSCASSTPPAPMRCT